ncbi:MAG: hypothetical protein HY738_05405 [Bacteroidia bacterium]|nr:hypothetical protein [Bacteroidia bacterium]
MQKKFTFVATTNGTILNNKILNVFQKYGSEIFISLDGPENVHNRNRPYRNGKSSFKMVMSKVKLLDKYNINYSFRPTITSDCDNLLEIIDLFEKLKTSFSFKFAFSSYYKDSESIKYEEKKIINITSQYLDLVKYYFEKVKKN